jgi:hypothetical protein
VVSDQIGDIIGAAQAVGAIEASDLPEALKSVAVVDAVATGLIRGEDFHEVAQRALGGVIGGAIGEFIGGSICGVTTGVTEGTGAVGCGIEIYGIRALGTYGGQRAAKNL